MSIHGEALMKRFIYSVAFCLLSLSGAASADEQPAESTRTELIDILALASDSGGSPFDSNSRKVTAAKCCKVCTKGKPCGDTCIAQDKVCQVEPGCAC